MSWRMASKSVLMSPSWLATVRSSSNSFAANSLCVVTMCRSRTKARITKTLIWTACGLFNTLSP